MNLDLREPTVVIAGAFNPAIFDVGWIASELFEYADGAPVNATLVADMARQTQRAYVDKIGIMAEAFRLSIFVDDLEPETIALAEKAVLRTASGLPHTPVAGLGINFKIAVPQPDAAIVDLLKLLDKPEQMGPVVQNEISSRIQIEDAVRLNFSRTILEDSLILGFNYHTDLVRLSEMTDTFEGKIRHWLDYSVAMIEQLYSLKEPLEITKALNN